MEHHAPAPRRTQKGDQRFVKLTARLPRHIFARLEREAKASGTDVSTTLRHRLEASVGGTEIDANASITERKLDQILAMQIAFRDQTFKETADQHSARILDMVNLQATSIDEVTQLRDVVIEAFEALKGALIALEKHVKPRKQT